MRRFVKGSGLVVALAVASTAVAAGWPKDVAGEVCWHDTGSCMEQGWRAWSDGTVATLDGHFGTWSLGGDQLDVNISEDRNGDGIVDYTAFYSGILDLATGCWSGTLREIDIDIARSADFQGCLVP